MCAVFEVSAVSWCTESNCNVIETDADFQNKYLAKMSIAQLGYAITYDKNV